MKAGCVGTEAIVRNLVEHTETKPLPPSWAAEGYRSYKPWKTFNDLENVFFCSIHLFDSETYPLSGEGPNGDSVELKNHQNVINIALPPIAMPDGKNDLGTCANK